MITLFVIRPKGFNVGNDAIFMGLQYFLAEAFGRVVNLISLPATSRYESHAKAGLTPKTIHEINQYGHGVIVGGGNLYENGELEVNSDSLASLETPLMLFSLSRGRMYNQQHKLTERTDAMPVRTIQALHGRADYSLARDSMTHEFLLNNGCEKAKLGGCPTIYLDRMSERLPQLSSRDQSGLLISVRNPALMNIPLQKQSEVHGDIGRLIEFFRKEGFKDIRLLCHDHRDIPFAATFHGVDFVYTGDIYTYLAMLRSCALNVSYRLHSVLPCLSFGTPAIKISYDERAESLMETIGYGEWNINLMRTGDLVAEVIDRYRRIKELPQLREQAAPVWSDLHAAMLDTTKAFAEDVFAYKRKCGVPL